MQSAKIAIVCGFVTVIVAASVRADWVPGDPYKMHYPQLPDPFGWDVNGTFRNVLADDWRCIETGPVSDIHLWGSWHQDVEGLIDRVHVSIHRDIPADPTNPDSYSQPGPLLWERDFFAGDFVYRPYGTGQQGWYDPATGQLNVPDHNVFHQINIVDIKDPFVQQVGQIYWLDVSVEATDPAGAIAQWGWKTSLEHFNDDAVWGVYNAVGVVDFWNELRDPTTGVSLDMAFVITPEPATLALLACGGLAAMIRRRRR